LDSVDGEIELIKIMYELFHSVWRRKGTALFLVSEVAEFFSKHIHLVPVLHFVEFY